MPTTRYLEYILALIITYLITTLAYIKGEGPRLSQGKQLRSDQGTPLLEHYYTWAFDCTNTKFLFPQYLDYLG